MGRSRLTRSAASSPRKIHTVRRGGARKDRTEASFAFASDRDRSLKVCYDRSLAKKQIAS